MTAPWPVTIFPDVELWACGFLQAELAARPEPYAAGVYVGNTVPEQRAARMVVVRRDGGPRLDRTRELARLTVRTWANSEQEVTDLGRLVAALLWTAPDGQPVIRVEQSTGLTPVADDSRQPLRLQTFELTVRGTDDTGGS
jgi:hypothetical protein